jgi:ABC-type glutathione transport system ATPase component
MRDPVAEDLVAPRCLGPAIAGEPARGACPAVGSGPRSSGHPAVLVERLSKRFGRRTAFEDVTFRVGTGAVFGFLGPNGAGKTTTVRTLGTLIALTPGSATVTGSPLNAENARRCGRGSRSCPSRPVPTFVSR